MDINIDLVELRELLKKGKTVVRDTSTSNPVRSSLPVKTCPQCGGDGLYVTETMARYGDEPVKCSMCSGLGSIESSD